MIPGVYCTRTASQDEQEHPSRGASPRLLTDHMKQKQVGKNPAALVDAAAVGR